jgi:hypothetical protein
MTDGAIPPAGANGPDGEPDPPAAVQPRPGEQLPLPSPGGPPPGGVLLPEAGHGAAKRSRRAVPVPHVRHAVPRFTPPGAAVNAPAMHPSLSQGEMLTLKALRIVIAVMLIDAILLRGTLLRAVAPSMRALEWPLLFISGAYMLVLNRRAGGTPGSAVRQVGKLILKIVLGLLAAALLIFGGYLLLVISLSN